MGFGRRAAMLAVLVPLLLTGCKGDKPVSMGRYAPAICFAQAFTKVYIDIQERLEPCEHSDVCYVTEPPGCNSEGHEYVYCKDCGELVSDSLIHKLNHKYAYEITGVTCVDSGIKKSWCQLCGKELDDEIVPAYGHDMIEHRTDPMVLSDGYSFKQCSRCGLETDFETLSYKDVCADRLSKRGGLYILDIPDLGVHVMCFPADCFDGEQNQFVVDAKDSAAYMSWGVESVIADHKHQGFSAIWDCAAGVKAYLTDANGTRSLTCVEVGSGTNTGGGIFSDSGHDAWNYNDGGICMYTCNEDWQHITVTFWSFD